LGGSDDLDNLALACRRCNEGRYNFVAGIDPKTREIVTNATQSLMVTTAWIVSVDVRD
jgi:hypothetical protein